MFVLSIWTFSFYELTFTNAISAFLTIIGIVGLYGYAFKVHIGRLGFWRKFAAFTAFVCFVVTIFLIYSIFALAEPEFVNSIRMEIGLLLLHFPLLYALVLYAKKSPEIWQEEISERQAS